MFTGIITDVGTISLVSKSHGTAFKIATTYDPASIDIGASIACAGACLTVIAKGGVVKDSWFSVEASAETLEKTNLGLWQQGTRINLERSLRIGDEIGGHIVSGHVDGTGEIISLAAEGNSTRVQIRAPKSLAKYIAPKGSIALDGTSLTVNGVKGSVFDVNIIPHTARVTTWGSVKAGDFVNIEIDVLARYLARLQEFA